MEVIVNTAVWLLIFIVIAPLAFIFNGIYCWITNEDCYSLIIVILSMICDGLIIWILNIYGLL